MTFVSERVKRELEGRSELVAGDNELEEKGSGATATAGNFEYLQIVIPAGEGNSTSEGQRWV